MLANYATILRSTRYEQAVTVYRHPYRRRNPWPRRLCASLFRPWRTSSWLAGVDGVHDGRARVGKEQSSVNHQGLLVAPDRDALRTARINLAQQILAKNTSLGTYETALSQAQLKVIQDEDAIAQNVCGQLTASQLAAASTLFTNLQSTKQTVHGYFQTAHQASGETSAQTSSQGTDQLPTD